jgi:hypothetical protein
VIILSLAFSGLLLADIWATPLSEEESASWAGQLLTAVPGSSSKDIGFPASIDANLSVSRGVARMEGKAAVVVIPDRGMVAEPNHPALDQEKGLPIGWIFLRGLWLVGIESAGVPIITLTEGSPAGQWYVLQMTARQIAPGEYRIEFWARKDKPLFAADLTTTRRTLPGPIDLHGDTGMLSIYALQKYAAFVPIAIPAGE